MNTLKNQNKGFALIEVLVALSITAILMTGLYSMTASVVKTKDGISQINNSIILSSALHNLIARDLRMSVPKKAGSVAQNNQREYVFTVISNNSLYFNRALPVEVSYFVEESTLYRHEFQEQMDFNMLIPLLDNVTGLNTETFISNRYTPGFNPAGYIYRFSFTVDGVDIKFTTGKVVKY